MKKNLPLLLFILFLTPVIMQGGASLAAFDQAHPITYSDDDTPKIKIYPNPATDYIELSENNQVAKIVVFNLVGREMKRFNAYNGQKYYIGDLERGLYLVQLLDKENQTIITQRVSKR
jgi:hypothetical protein